MSISNRTWFARLHNIAQFIDDGATTIAKWLIADRKLLP